MQRPRLARTAAAPLNRCPTSSELVLGGRAAPASAASATAGSAGSTPASNSQAQLISPSPRGGRRATTIRPAASPRSATRRCSSTLAVTRSRTSCEQPARVGERERVHRRGPAELADLGDPQPLRRRGPSRRSRPAPTGAGRLAAASAGTTHQRVAGAEQPGAVGGRRVREHLVAAGQAGARDARRRAPSRARAERVPHASPPMAFSRSVRRCCSRATSSPNIRLYSVACSTGLVRCSRDLRSAIRRIAVISWSR